MDITVEVFWARRCTGNAQDGCALHSPVSFWEGCNTGWVEAAYRQACLDYDPNLLGNIAIPIRRLAEENWRKSFGLWISAILQEIFPSVVILANRQIKQLESVSEREWSASLLSLWRRNRCQSKSITVLAVAKCAMLCWPFRTNW